MNCTCELIGGRHRTDRVLDLAEGGRNAFKCVFVNYQNTNSDPSTTSHSLLKIPALSHTHTPHYITLLQV